VKPLNDKEVDERRNKNGFNELAEKEKNKFLLFISEVFSEPMFILLVSCALLYLLIGDKLEGTVLLLSVSVIIFITFYQRQKTEKALSELKKLSAPFATVLREKGVIKIKSREIVKDDVLILEEGDLIAADATLFECNNLLINESPLSGEAYPVNKSSTNENSENKLFAGTFILQGNAKAIVTAIGNQTQIGKIGKSLLEIPSNETRLQKEMKFLVRKLFFLGIFISCAVILLFYFLRGNWVQSLLTGLSSAMAILPEEFPVVLTVFLTLGSWKLAKQNVLTRYPAAIENLGATSVLCTDKTGTITENKMELMYCYNNKSIFGKVEFNKYDQELQNTITTAFYACPEYTSDPMERAIQELVKQTFKINSSYQLIKEFPFNKDELSVTRIVQTDICFAAVKGAPEEILKRSSLSEEDKNKHIQALNELTKKGLRVLGVGKQVFTTKNYPIKQQDFKLDFLGWLAFEDPLKEGIKESVQLCNTAGIQVVLITGDYKETGIEIARQAGIYTNGIIVSGDELDNLNDDELSQKIKNIQLFYRVKPLQKLRIVNALKKNKEVVSMTGDGINDASALKAADVGIAMGKRGTAVAKDASSIILLDDDFKTIVEGIKLGRKIFDNLQKAFSYIISIHVPIVGLTILPAFMYDFPILLMPLHIVLLELMIDPISSVTFEKLQEDKNSMHKPPRSFDIKFFNYSQWLTSIIDGVILFSMLLIAYAISKHNTTNDAQIRSVVFITFISGNILLVINKVTKTPVGIGDLKKTGKIVLITSAIISLCICIIFIVPVLRKLFRFELPDIQSWIIIFFSIFFMQFLFQGMKRVNLD